MGARARLRARIAAVVAAGALLVAGGVTLLLTNTISLRGSAVSTDRADAYLLRVVELERLVVDAETGLRGKVITGHGLFLQPLYRAQSQLPGAMAALRQAAFESRMYQAQSAALIAAARSYMTSYVPDVLVLTRHDLAAARSFSVTLQGKHEVDEIRARASPGSSACSHEARRLVSDLRAVPPTGRSSRQSSCWWS